MDEYRQRESLNFEKTASRKKKSRFLTFSLDNTILVIGYVAVVVLVLVLWMGSHLGSEGGVIQKSDVGSIALHDYKAPRDFVYDRVDREATDRIRAQRVAEVLPIYTWNNDYYTQTVENVNAAFDMMRDRFVKYREREMAKRIPKIINDITTPKNVNKAKQDALLDAMFEPFSDQPEVDPFLSTRTVKEEELSQILANWTSDNKPEFEEKIGVQLDDELFSWLVQNSFAREIQDEIVRILSTVLSQKIVNSRASLDENERVTVQWLENSIKRTKTFTESDKSIVSTVEDGQTLIRSMVTERLGTAPEVMTPFLSAFVIENLTYDDAATQRERTNVSEKTAELRVFEEYKKGQTVIASGEPIREEHFDLFDKMMQGQTEYDNRAGHWFSIIIVVLLAVGLGCRPILKNDNKGFSLQKRRDMIFVTSVLLVYALGLKLLALVFATFDSVYHLPYSLFLLFPFASGSMLIRLVINRQFAFYFSVMAAVITTLMSTNLNIVLPYAFLTIMAGCLLIDRPKRSSAVLNAGIWLGAISAIMGIAIYIRHGGDLTWQNYLVVAVLGIASGLLSSGMIMIGLPLAESIFGYATSNKLLELSNLEHPALKTLFMEAPGTYQHSIMVGTLNEAAADAIGANSILARVGGYYHDIGKAKNAQYFAENQHGDNPHNRLKPNMSALILKTHERDGLEIAKKYHLPKDIMDFIISHHGTSRIEFFYQNAIKTQTDVREDDYRYPGPRPQTRETGICMVSDMVEAAVRSMPDKSPDRIKVLVRKLINHKFADGQFDECDLTLRDLNDIADAVCGILNAFYHHRPEYPDQKREREKAEAEKKARELAEAEKANAQEQSAVNDKINKSSDLLEKVDKQDKNEKSDRSGIFEKVVKSEKSEKTDKPSKSNKYDKIEKTSKSDQYERVEKEDKSLKTEKSENKKSERPEIKLDSLDNATRVDGNHRVEHSNRTSERLKSVSVEHSNRSDSDAKVNKSSEKLKPVSNDNSNRSGFYNKVSKTSEKLKPVPAENANRSDYYPKVNKSSDRLKAVDGKAMTSENKTPMDAQEARKSRVLAAIDEINSMLQSDEPANHKSANAFDNMNDDLAVEDSVMTDRSDLFEPESVAPQVSGLLKSFASDLPDDEPDEMAEANELLKDEIEEANQAKAKPDPVKEAEVESQMLSEAYELPLSSKLDVFKKS